MKSKMMVLPLVAVAMVMVGRNSTHAQPIVSLNLQFGKPPPPVVIYQPQPVYQPAPLIVEPQPVVEQPPMVVVEPAPVIVEPAPVYVEMVPTHYVLIGTTYYSVVGDSYVYLGPGNVWMVCEPWRVEHFHTWERSHHDWRPGHDWHNYAVRNERFQSTARIQQHNDRVRDMREANRPQTPHGAPAQRYESARTADSPMRPDQFNGQRRESPKSETPSTHQGQWGEPQHQLPQSQPRNVPPNGPQAVTSTRYQQNGQQPQVGNAVRSQQPPGSRQPQAGPVPRPQGKYQGKDSPNKDKTN